METINVVDEAFGFPALQIFLSGFRQANGTHLIFEAQVMAEAVREKFLSLQESGSIPFGAQLPKDVTEFLQGPVLQ